MRLAIFAAVSASVLSTPAAAQERVGTVQQPQTAAPIITLERPQPMTCGVAPNVAQINRLVAVVRRMFAQPAAFNAALTAEIRQTCQRNRVAAYLVRVIAANNWAFAPAPGLRIGSPPLGAGFACGPAASTSDLNALIAKMRPLFPNPAPFNANITALGHSPCTDGRATYYLYALMTDNDLTFRR